MTNWREWRRNAWVYPLLVLVVAPLNWLLIALPAKRWKRTRPESQT